MSTLILLIIVIAAIVISTTKFRLHPFLSLLLAALAMGFSDGLDAQVVVGKMSEGFGGTLKSIGIVIAFGTIIGTFLERSGGAHTMATAILKLVGEKRAPFAMSLTGFIVSIPVFCDSGFVVLSTLNRALSKKTGLSLSVLAVALATGLYATHVFVPPTPGPLAAAAALGADIGVVLLLGLVVAIPSAAAGLLWALFYSVKFQITPHDLPPSDEEHPRSPGVMKSFAPILLPILLITLKSVAEYPTAPLGKGFMQAAMGVVGHPIVALMLGVFTAFFLKKKDTGDAAFDWVALGLKNAGAIILITGAGGAFGNVLRATDLGDTLGQLMSTWHVGIFLPFLIAAVLKSAQGSSTVAIITTAALVSPLLDSLGLSSEIGKALCVLAIGAGAMTVSHVNDSYFWVVAQFSNMDTSTALRCQTLATLAQGVTGIMVIFLLTRILN